MDKISAEQRHKNMAAIRSKNTKPEMLVRRWLWARGFRYRLNSPRLPGHPDLVLRKYRTCIFVNGCFWHGHHVDFGPDGTALLAADSPCCKIPHTNREFCVKKIRRNQERDTDTQKRLAQMGWHCITVWECQLKPPKRTLTLTSLEFTLNRIWLDDHSVSRNYPQLDDEQPLQQAAEHTPQRR
jgi:DNA mismatch endonuclease (patch repair protein)